MNERINGASIKQSELYKYLCIDVENLNITIIDCPSCGGHGYFDSSRTAEVKCGSCTDGRVKAIILENE